MNIEQAIEHGRAWVAAGWTWAPGQAVIFPHRDGAVADWLTALDVTYGTYVGMEMVPDMRDRGTLGHALGQVRDAWGSPGAGAGMKRLGGQAIGGWAVSGVARGDDCASYFGFGDTEAEALLAARRAAP